MMKVPPRGQKGEKPLLHPGATQAVAGSPRPHPGWRCDNAVGGFLKMVAGLEFGDENQISLHARSVPLLSNGRRDNQQYAFSLLPVLPSCLIGRVFMG